MWAGNSKCCGLTWNLSLKWGFNGEIVVESVFICVHNHPQWLSKFKSLTNLIPWDLNCWDTKGPSWSFLLVGTEHNNFFFFILCALRVGYWCDYWCQFEPCGSAAAKSIQECSWLMIKPLIRHFWWCFWGNIWLLETPENSFWVLEWVWLCEGSQWDGSGGYRWDISKIVLFMSHFRKFGWILYKSFLS